MIQLEQIQKELGEEIRRDSRRVMVVGVLALALGVLSLGYASVVTVTSVYVFGAALAVGGIYHLAHAVKYRDAIGLLIDTPMGITETVVGVLLLSKPGASLLGLTLLTAAFLVIAGLFRTILSVSVKLPNWGWSFASGLASIALGLMVWLEWPVSALWVLGTFVSVYLIMSGGSYIMLGMAARKAFPRPSPQPAT